MSIQGHKEWVSAYLASPALTPFTKPAFAQLFVRIVEGACVQLGAPVVATSTAGS